MALGRAKTSSRRMLSVGITCVGGCWLTMLWGRADLTCDRATGTCTVVEWRSILRSRHDIPLRDILGARSEVRDSRKTSDHGVVVLDTPGGPRTLTRDRIATSPAAAEDLATDLGAWLSDPSRPRFHGSVSTDPVFSTIAALSAGVALGYAIYGVALIVARVRGRD